MREILRTSSLSQAGMICPVIAAVSQMALIAKSGKCSGPMSWPAPNQIAYIRGRK